MGQKHWKTEQQEYNVHKFYSTGIEGFHDYHKGYLNFGYWTHTGMSYEEAAENLIRHMAETLGLNSSSVLLDVGCGMGTQDVFLAQTINPKRIEAVDVTWKHIQRAKERAQRAGIISDKLEFQHGTAVDLPFAEESFTHVLSVEAPEHFDTRENFFHEAYRVLRPGGILAIADYSLARQPKNLFDTLIVEFARRIWHVPKENVYGNEIFKAKLEKAGFVNVAINNIGGLTIPGYYYEGKKPETRCETRKVRGLKGLIGTDLVDFAVYTAWKRGLCEYIVVRAEKP